MKNSNLLNIILATSILLLLIKLNYQTDVPKADDRFDAIVPQATTEQNNPQQITHQAWVKLTVAESKRLIAKGLVKYPPVAQKLKSGQVIIARGTSNTYVAEEILGDSIVHGAFVTGRISPAKGPGIKNVKDKLSELLIRDGQRLNVPFEDALEATSNYDIVLKGANLLNYAEGKAAVLVGHPTGGTIGQILRFMQKDKIKLIVPVGLEKNSSVPLQDISESLTLNIKNIKNKVPKMQVLPGEIFTEIEALKQFASVEVTQIGSGGVAGAEGAVVLLIRGEEADVKKALEVVDEIQGEPAF